MDQKRKRTPNPKFCQSSESDDDVEQGKSSAKKLLSQKKTEENGTSSSSDDEQDDSFRERVSNLMMMKKKVAPTPMISKVPKNKVLKLADVVKNKKEKTKRGNEAQNLQNLSKMALKNSLYRKKKYSKSATSQGISPERASSELLHQNGDLDLSSVNVSEHDQNSSLPGTVYL